MTRAGTRDTPRPITRNSPPRLVRRDTPRRVTRDPPPPPPASSQVTTLVDGPCRRAGPEVPQASGIRLSVWTYFALFFVLRPFLWTAPPPTAANCCQPNCQLLLVAAGQQPTIVGDGPTAVVEWADSVGRLMTCVIFREVQRSSGFFLLRTVLVRHPHPHLVRNLVPLGNTPFQIRNS